jgi:hypothetical protein
LSSDWEHTTFIVLQACSLGIDAPPFHSRERSAMAG